MSLPNSPSHRATLNRQSSSPLPQARGSDVNIHTLFGENRTDFTGRDEETEDGRSLEGKESRVLVPAHQLQVPSGPEPPSAGVAEGRETEEIHSASGNLPRTPSLQSDVAAPTAGASGSRATPMRPGIERTQSLRSGRSNPRVGGDEEEFLTKGYLIAPYPRDEIERRRALYKCVPIFFHI